MSVTELVEVPDLHKLSTKNSTRADYFSFLLYHLSFIFGATDARAVRPYFPRLLGLHSACSDFRLLTFDFFCTGLFGASHLKDLPTIKVNPYGGCSTPNS
jgi:hypothetical protein